MTATYLILLAVGIGIIWVGLRSKDEVYRLASGVTGAIFLIWGFALTPSQLQFLVEAITLVAIFPICMRCLRE
jgi:VIT1/CCC1 family predicted Fe2+/Mn2+ transporter